MCMCMVRYLWVHAWRCGYRDTPGTVRKYVSSNYVLHSFESPTGYRFLMTSSRDAGDLRVLLADLYSTVFLPHAVFNPLYEMGTEITCPRFIAGTALVWCVSPRCVCMCVGVLRAYAAGGDRVGDLVFTSHVL